MKYLIILSVFTAFIVNSVTNSNSIKVLSSQEFKAKIENDKVQLIDVRTPKEFKEGHLKNAINIDFYSNTFNEEFNKLNKEEAVYIYCRSGSRSKKSSKKLEVMGFTEIYDLKGGLLNYNK